MRSIRSSPVRKTFLSLGLPPVAFFLAACTGSVAQVIPTPVPALIPTPTPTVRVELIVNSTSIPVRHHHHHAVPTATPFVPPAHTPYVVLLPSSGPPVNRQITIRGGNMPPSSPIQLIWAPVGHTSPISTGAQTNGKGRFRASFSVPAAPPAVYKIVASVSGVPYAFAKYTVTSAASLKATSSLAAGGAQVQISGVHFVPRVTLLLVAYRVNANANPIVLGRVKSGATGRFGFNTSNPRLQPGQYVLRAWSVSGVVAEMSETFFEVVD